MADITKVPGDSGNITVPEGVHSYNADGVAWGGDGGSGGVDGSFNPVGGGGGGGGESFSASGVSCSPGDTISYSVASSNSSNTTFASYTLHPGGNGSGPSGGSGGLAGSAGSGGSGTNNGSGGTNGDSSTGGAGGNAGSSSISGSGGAGSSVDGSPGSGGGNYGAGGGAGYGSGASGGSGAASRIELTWATRSDLYAPSSVSHNTVTEVGATVTWTDNSGNESGYEIEVYTYGASPVGTATHTAAANTTSKVITTLDPAQHYSFVIRAVDSGLAIGSSWAGTDDFTTDPLGIPTTLNATSVTDTTLTLTPSLTTASLSWTDNSTSNDAFDIELVLYGDSFTGTPTDSLNVGDTPYAATGLTPLTQYKFQVRATKDGTFTSDWSSSNSFTTDTASSGGNTALGYFVKGRR